MRTIYNYAQKALDVNPNDAKLTEFRNELKVKFDKLQAKDKEEKKAAEEAKPKPETQAKGKGLKRVIVTDPEEEKETKKA